MLGKTQTFMSVIAILGFLMVVISWGIESKINGCEFKNLRNANRFCLVFGAILMTMGVTLFGAQKLHGVKIKSQPFLYDAIISLLGFTILVLGSVIRTDTSHTDCEVAGPAGWLIVIGLATFLAPIGYHMAPKKWFPEA